MKCRAHKHLFRTLDTIVSRKFGHSLINHKVRGNTDNSFMKPKLKTLYFLNNHHNREWHRFVDGPLREIAPQINLF